MSTSYKILSNAIRFLSADAVYHANSGHPGMPLGMADIAVVLWKDFLKHNPNDPKWLNRDRFVLSNGHGSMLLYSLLHLTGYEISIDDIKNFRKLHSKTPGHPEFGVTPGVETTTGPLGQGLANAVGMALAEKVLAAQFNKPEFEIIDHYTYAFVGDGCLMEGISHEVSSLAGTLGLGKLIVFWDDNGISIDGQTKNWFADNTILRFKAYNWQVIENVDGHNHEAVRQAIEEARSVIYRPTIICCKTIIGFGAPTVSGSSSCHGSPLDENEILKMRENLNWQYPPFVIPQEIYQAYNAKEAGKKSQSSWQEIFNSYQKQYPDLANELLRRISKEFPKDWLNKTQKHIEQTCAEKLSIATRQASQKSLNFFAPFMLQLLGGSADLTPSNLTNWSGSKDITKDNFDGNYLHYGVREFGMFAIMNGISLHGGFIPYGGTFLVFVGYGHNAIRMSAIMKQQVIYVFTHDSIGLGEDGPTHQPVEQLAMLRATPNVSVWRPSDSTETACAWQYALEHKTGPTVLALTRQKVAFQDRDKKSLENIKRGGYILIDTNPANQKPDCILIATGSEVELAVNIARKLKEKNISARVVSMPSQDVFDKQDAEYKEGVLPSGITKRLAIEAASSQSWYKYVGIHGKILGLDRYGESAPDKILFEFFGFSAQNGLSLISD